MSAHNQLHDLYKAPYLMADPGSAGTINVDRQLAIAPITTAGAEARTLAQPTKAGLICTVVLDVYVGTLTLTVTGGFDQGGSTTMAFGTAGDWATFMSVKVGTSYYWRVLKNEGTDYSEDTGTFGGLTATNANVTTAIATTMNATSSTITNANSTTAIATTMNATNSTITNANSTTAIAATANATNSTIATANVTTGTITNATLGRMQITSAAVTAAGSALGNAANLSYGMNIVSGTDNTTGVILPVAVANGIVEVLQTVNAKQLAIYPQANSSIAGLTANVALNTGVANTAAQAGTTQNVHFKLVATNATQWYVSK